MLKGFKPGSRKWKIFMAKLYGWGASVVILGALFKIQHYPGAGIMLVAGLGTEAVIFFFSAFEPVHEEIDWSIVYPELSAPHGEGEHAQLEEGATDEGTILEQLDNMLEEAKIGPELIDSLGEGLRSLSDNTAKLTSLSDATVATEEFLHNVKNASASTKDLSSSASQLSTAYTNSAEELSSAASQLSQTYASTAEQLRNELSITDQEGGNYRQQLQNFTNNLSALNAAYESQVKGTAEHMEATNKLYEGVQELLHTLNSSISDTKKYKENMTDLSDNLNALNTVYGNMLTAMGSASSRQTKPRGVAADGSDV